ncbi:Uncharacterised protein [[Flavobacterium] thermophilum]|nr:Uncharacterised protein [[Flavobacterium] thermophilum]
MISIEGRWKMAVACKSVALVQKKLILQGFFEKRISSTVFCNKSPVL